MTYLSVIPSGPMEARLWRTTLELCSLFADWPWVVIGAQMVIILELEAGHRSGRTTVDVDALLDVRAVSHGAREGARRLLGAGFTISQHYPNRFVRDREQVDLLAPDHLGARVDLTTVPPGMTAAIPGGRRALETRRLVGLDIVGGDSAMVPVPTLTGALVLKLSAAETRQEARDLQDIVRMLAIIDDVEEVRSSLRQTERRRFATLSHTMGTTNPAWRIARDPEDARIALARISQA
jgi:hypothetical protein